MRKTHHSLIYLFVFTYILSISAYAGPEQVQPESVAPDATPEEITQVQEVTQTLTEAALSEPEVQEYIEESVAELENQKPETLPEATAPLEPTSSPAPIAQTKPIAPPTVFPTQAVTMQIAKKKRSKKSDVRRKYKLGFDVELGVPDGASIALAYAPVAPLTLKICGGTTGFTASVCSEVTVAILPNRRWSPVISLRFSHIFVTQLSERRLNSAVRANLPDEADAESYISGRDSTHLDIAGQRIDTLTLMGGVDFISKKKGIHFRLLAGGTVRISGSRASGGNILTATGLVSPAFGLSVGRYFELAPRKNRK